MIVLLQVLRGLFALAESYPDLKATANLQRATRSPASHPIARSLAGNPDLLMLDEPSQGLAPLLVRELHPQPPLVTHSRPRRTIYKEALAEAE